MCNLSKLRIVLITRFRLNEIYLAKNRTYKLQDLVIKSKKYIKTTIYRHKGQYIQSDYMELQKTQMIGIAVCIAAVVVIAGAAVIFTNGDNDDSKGNTDIMAGVGLKVLGNLDKDTDIDADDLALLKQKVESNTSYNDCPLADVNNDKKIDAEDVAALEKIIAAIADTTGNTKATIWHYNYHDSDGNGTMDTELVSTTFPIKAMVMCGSANTFIMAYTLGIIDEVKGAAYSTTNDKWLYENTYLDTTKVVKVGTSATTIAFEDGKIGSSDTIDKNDVTCVLSDWNKSYLTNEDKFREAGLNVVRIAASSFEPEVYTHSISLLGLLFAKEDNASKLLTYYNEAYNDIKDAVATLPADKVKKAIASSSNGSISSADSDYTAFCIAAGAEFGLKGYDFGGSASIKVADNLGIFDTRTYNFDNIVHIRTALTYASTTDEVAKYWSEYANAMSLWEHAYDGQVLVSGSIPVPARIAYIAYAIYGQEVDALNLDWANGIHNKLASLYQSDKKIADAPNKTFVLNSYEYTITVEDGVTVKTTDGKAVNTGDKFAYGTKLLLSATVTKEGYTLRADGSTLNDDGSFIVCDNIRARYVDNAVLDKLTSTANAFVNAYKEGTYGKASAAADNEGVFTMSGTYYNGTATSKDLKFTYCDSADTAKTQFDTVKAQIEAKGKAELDVSGFSDKFDGIYVQYTNSISSTKNYIGSTIYLCAYKGNMIIDMCNNSSYLGNYYCNDDTYQKYEKDDAGRAAFFKEGVTAFVTALATALNTA